MLSPEKDFDYFVRSPVQWTQKAQTLWLAAQELFRQFEESFGALGRLDGVPMEEAAPVLAKAEFYQPAAMLAGFSLEVLIKANIVALYPDRLQPGMSVKDWTGGKPINGHDLTALSEAADLEVADHELLSVLTKFSVWKGRYPSSMGGTPMYGSQTEFENFASTHWIDLSKRYNAEFLSFRTQVQRNSPSS